MHIHRFNVDDTSNGMNIGCDLDGVIVDHRRNQQRLLRARNINLPLKSISKKSIKQSLAPADYESFKDELYGPLSLTADEIPGANDALYKISQAGHILYLISRREQGQGSAKLWLEQRGYGKIFPDENTFFVSSDREKEDICKKFSIEMHIDDTPEVLDVLRTPRHKILFANSALPHANADLTTKEWPEILEFVLRNA